MLFILVRQRTTYIGASETALGLVFSSTLYIFRQAQVQELPDLFRCSRYLKTKKIQSYHLRVVLVFYLHL